jgi:hypothetical protein
MILATVCFPGGLYAYYFMDNEVDRFLKAAKEYACEGTCNYTMPIVLRDPGVRVSELVNLGIDDLFLDGGYFRDPGKGHKHRIVPLDTTVEKPSTSMCADAGPCPAWVVLQCVVQDRFCVTFLKLNLAVTRS